MYACMVRKHSALILIAIITMMGIVASAQTRTVSSRPKVITNSTSEYKYAYQHGYKAGYEDGFRKGKADVGESREFEVESSDQYQQADRTYSANMGTRPEYQESYRVGFEIGASDGYYGRQYSERTPDNLGRVVVTTINNATPATPPPSQRNTAVLTKTQSPPPLKSQNDDDDDKEVARNNGVNKPIAANASQKDRTRRREIRVPSDIQMKVRLQTQINTKTNVEGDKFTVVVLDPSDYVDAIIEGHISKLAKSGKATGKTELSFTFDSITFADGRTGIIDAQIERVLNSDSVKTVDEEGNVQSGSRGKDTATRTVGAGALGAVIGAIAGGGKGAAIGAIIGASVGAGSVMVQDGKHLILEPGTEILIRTKGPE